MGKARDGGRGQLRGILGRRVTEYSGGPLAVAATLGMVTTPHDLTVAGIASAGTLVAAGAHDAVTALVSRVQSRRTEAAEATLGIAVEESGLALEQLANRAEHDPFVRRVFTEAMAGAADATYDEKLVALGSLLARALSAEERAEQGRLLSQATVLRVLEEPHALVLLTIYGEPPVAGADAEGPWHGWTYATLQMQLQLGALATPVMETLTAYGLIRRSGERVDHPDMWVTTAFGDSVVKLLREAASALD